MTGAGVSSLKAGLNSTGPGQTVFHLIVKLMAFAVVRTESGNETSSSVLPMVGAGDGAVVDGAGDGATVVGPAVDGAGVVGLGDGAAVVGLGDGLGVPLSAQHRTGWLVVSSVQAEGN